MNSKYVLVIVLLVVLVLFLILNSAQTQVNFIFFKVITSTAILIFISAIIGFIIGAALSHTLSKSKKPVKAKNAKV